MYYNSQSQKYKSVYSENRYLPSPLPEPAPSPDGTYYHDAGYAPTCIPDKRSLM